MPEQFISVDPLSQDKTRPRVLIIGCWDLFHAGHLHFIKEVYEKHVMNTRELHVGVPNDTCFTAYKGRSPIYPFEERKAILEAIRYVTEVHEYQIWRDVPNCRGFPEDGHRFLLDKVKPVLFVDSIQKAKEDIGVLPYLWERGIASEYVNSIDIHTTQIIERIRS